MQTTIGSYEAKTHLPAILNRVEQGEQFTITRHGVAVAVLLPPPRERMQRRPRSERRSRK